MGNCHSGCRAGGSADDAAAAADDTRAIVGDVSLTDGEQKGSLPGSQPQIAGEFDRLVSPKGAADDPALSRQVSAMSRQLSPTSEDAMVQARAQKVMHGTGFFAGLDTRSSNALKVLQTYGAKNLDSPEEVAEQLQALKVKVMKDPSFNGDKVVGVMMDAALMSAKVNGRQKISSYLWKEKQIVPFFSFHGLAPEKDGVELMQDEDMEEQLATASSCKVHGVKGRCMIRAPNEEGIRAAVDQQMGLAKAAATHGLACALHLEVSIDASDKASCEAMLLKTVHEALDALEGDLMVILVLTLPNKPNTFLTLAHHPRVMRLLALSGGYSRDDSCTMLTQNACTTACFSRALLEMLRVTMSDEEFSASLQQCCDRIADCCKETPTREQQLAKIDSQDGIFATLDDMAIASAESLERLGYEAPKGGWSDDEIAAKAGHVTWRIVSDKNFSGTKVLACVIHEMIRGVVIDEMTLPAFLWTHRKVVPILRLSRHTQEGKLRPDFDSVLAQAKADGYFSVMIGTKIRKPERIRQQITDVFSYAQKMRDAGLVPYLQCEVVPECTKKNECEHILFDELVAALGKLKPGDHVMLAMSIPVELNLYLPLTQNPNVIRVSGRYRGVDKAAACALLSKCYGITSAFGQAFTEGLNDKLDEETFSTTLQKNCHDLFEASAYIPVKEIQAAKVANTDGFFVALDQSGDKMLKILQTYGVKESELAEKAEAKIHVRQMKDRLLSNPTLNGSVALGATISIDMLSQQLSNRPLPKYLWEVKKMVPFIALDKGLQPEQNGVMMMAEVPDLEKIVSKASKAGVAGGKTRAVIRSANKSSIGQVCKQQLSYARKMMEKNMVPLIQIEIEIGAKDKSKCERYLVLQMLSALKSLKSGETVLLWLTIPETPNIYLPLTAHPNIGRIMALSGGYDHAESCRRLSQNVGIIAGFGRALFEGLGQSQSEQDFNSTLDKTCKSMFQVSRSVKAKQMQLARMATQDGFVAALDSQGETLAKVMQLYAGCSANTDQSTLNREAHKMRMRIMTNPVFNGSRAIACVIPEDMVALNVNRMLCAKYLWEVKKVIPFLRIDVGLASEARGVCMMQNMNAVMAGVEKAAAFGCFGTKARTLIKSADAEGIKAAVEQQFEVAKCAVAQGLVPILQVEVDANAQDKPRCEQLLRNALAGGLRTLDSKDQVILELTMPSKAGSFAAFVTHPNVLRTVALSGGFSRAEACRHLRENQGFIGAFGRALIQDVTVKQTEGEFTRNLDNTMDDIFLSSVKIEDSVDDSTNMSSKRSLKSAVKEVKGSIKSTKSDASKNSEPASELLEGKMAGG